MATEQDTSSTEATLRPQTPAARAQNPEANRERTPEERERLREESRARRKARAEGRVVAPEPPAEEIKLRRATDEEREAPAKPAAPLPRAEPAKPAPAKPEPSAANGAAPAKPVPPAAEPPAPPASPRPAPATPAAGRVASLPWLQPSRPETSAEPEEATPAEAEHTAPAAPPSRTPPPPRAARQRPRLELPALPSAPRERATVLLAIASAIGVVIALASTLSSGSLLGLGGGGFRAKAEARVVAPGGWLTLLGADAPGGGKVVLESRGHGENWHSFGEGQANGNGAFAVKGRVLERPGRVQLRARVPGAATTDPIPVIVRPLRLAAVGDINLDGAPAKAWQGVGHALRKADVSFGNLESTVSTRGTPYDKEYNFRAKPAALAGLAKHSGIDVLNLANNHTGDYGPQALLDTVNAVRKDGIKPVGAGADVKHALRPQVVRRLGLRVAFVGFSEIAPIEFSAGTDRPGTAWANPSEIIAAVHAARRKADIVVATFHWGIERQTLETERQRQLADVAVKAGAQVVVGAHPHTLQPVRRQGGAIVAYSLGNFVFDAQSPETTTTGILQLDLTADGVTRARWRSAHISGGRPLLNKQRAKRLPLRDSIAMQAGVNLPQL
jgi:poly-gamma-glutamate capsule biosynthesis protein CapA/YwtB (metallophosphatase superfamily)